MRGGFTLVFAGLLRVLRRLLRVLGGLLPVFGSLLPIFGSLLLVAGLSGCSLFKQARPTPTLNVTQALQTVSARLTLAAALTPTRLVSSTPTSLAGTPGGVPEATTPPAQTEPVLSPTIEPSAPLLTVTLDANCDQAAPGNPIDVTIDDYTLMLPGQKFTKIWRLINAGNCTWTQQYAAVWFYGEKLGDTLAVPMSHAVPPGESVDITVDMVAPQGSGTYDSNWKLRNAGGVLFGIGPNGDQPFWVRIVVVEAATDTSTPTSPPASPTSTTTRTPTVTPTPTSTPAVLTSGSATLSPNDLFDLDANQVNPSGGVDLAYLADANGAHWLTPQSGAILGVYGFSAPTLQACQAATMSAAPIAVESLSPGAFLCYRTDQGNPGWLQLSTLNTADFSIQVEILTWKVVQSNFYR